MAVPMVSLRRAANGDWFSRKGIPKDLREAYRAAHGKIEERFRRPGSLSVDKAKQELREWDALISGRLNAMRAAERGEGQSLTHRQAHALAGEWYLWFVEQYEDEPGIPEQWDLMYDQIEDTYLQFAPRGADPRDLETGWMGRPTVRRHVRAKLAERGQVPSFLAGKQIVLQPEAYDLLLDTLEDEFAAALGLLKRRALGDYEADTRPKRFPNLEQTVAAKASGVTPWKLFELWVRERKPAISTVNRWRAVFRVLDAHFEGKDIASITPEAAVGWKNTLVTPARSSEVANEVWLRAARTVFSWAVDNRMISTNPFDGVSVATSGRRKRVREREFNDNEWKTILTATLQPTTQKLAKHNADARRWVPWLAAYTGSRAGELTQLRVEDVQRHPNGFWTIHITPDAGTVKGGEARTVPLHEHLIEQGFIQFVQSKSSGPLFYDLSRARAKENDPFNPKRSPWVKARQKIAEWVRSLGVTDPNISPIHAWRHTFKRRAARVGIEPRIRDAICGHAPATVGREYERPTVEDMAAALESFPRYLIAPS